MESATFRKWLVEQGCRIDGDEHPRGHEGHVMVTVHREDRKTRVPLGGSRQALDPRVVRRACDKLGLDPSQLPGSLKRRLTARWPRSRTTSAKLGIVATT